jgi:hypothetical protein
MSKFCSLLTLFLVFITFNKDLTAANFSIDSTRVYLITASPGEETYAAFGHSAIRIHDTSNELDLAFNFGTFDFSTPNFYGKFIFGRLMYALSISTYQQFLTSYYYSGQAIFEQELNLTRGEKETLIKNLEENYKEENRYYRYDFFYDNCATRIRDIVAKSVDGEIVYDKTLVKKKRSFRRLLKPYLGVTPWTYLGTNILMGRGTDKIAQLEDYMFLPEHMMDFFSVARVETNGNTRLLAAEPVEFFPARLTITRPSWYLSPSFVLWILAVIVVLFTIKGFFMGRYYPVVDVVLFLIAGLLGSLVLVLWVGSLHEVLSNNYNIWWANPLSLILAVSLVVNSKSLFTRRIATMSAILLFLFIPVSFILSQKFDPAIYPLVTVLLIRSWRIATRKLSIQG